MWSVDTYQEICQVLKQYVEDGCSTTAESLHESLSICSSSDVATLLRDAAEIDNLTYQSWDSSWHLTARGLEEFACSSLKYQKPVNRY